MALYPASPRPSYPIEERAAAPDVLISQHRDGSEQRRLKAAGKGRQFTLSYGSSLPITHAERQVILDHYAAQHGKLEAFEWRHPERTWETLTVRYGEPPEFTHTGYDAYEGRVVLEEVPA
jgi:phage-related protein